MYTKRRRDLEPRWTSDYITTRYPDGEHRLRCPLGPIPKSLVKEYGLRKAIRVHRPWRPEVDALVILPGTLVLVEAKVFKYMDGVSKLPVYASLVPETPELRRHRDKPVRMELLVPATIDWLETAAAKLGVQIVTWAPDYIKKAWEERDKYWTPPYILKRERRKEILRRLGFD